MSLSDKPSKPQAAAEERRQFVNFAFYQVDPAWRRLPEEDRKRGKAEFIAAVKANEQDVMVIPYSMVGRSEEQTSSHRSPLYR